MSEKEVISVPKGINTIILEKGCKNYAPGVKVVMQVAMVWSVLAVCAAAPEQAPLAGLARLAGLTGLAGRSARSVALSIGGGECAEARLRCAYRTGCGAALTNYLLWCSDVVHGAPGCPEPCQHALIALTSTEEGKNLMNCECNDDYCQETKQRVEVCRPQVLRASLNETVSCRVSQLICAADPLCSTALDYYRRFCRSMFHGRKCSHRCLNSIDILRRQDKAAKLSTCKCDGFEDYDCPKVQTNMARLCFHKTKPMPDDRESTTVREDLRTNEVSSGGSLKASLTVFSVLLVLSKFTDPD